MPLTREEPSTTFQLPNDINIALQCANCARYNKDGILGEEWWEEGEKEQGHHIVIPTTHPILSHLTNTLTNIHPS